MKIAKRLDDIFEEAEQAFDENHFNEINDKLKGIDVENEPIAILLGWLTVCLPVYSKLSYIERFFERIEEKLKKTETEERVAALLKGLNPNRKNWYNNYVNQFQYYGWE